MKLGMPALLEYGTLEENAALCAALGLDFIELNMNLPLCMPDRLDAGLVRRMSRETGIGFTLHLPEELEPASFHAAIRRGHLACCLDAMDWAAAAGIGLLNMHVHNGVYFTLPGGRTWINEAHDAEYAALLHEAFATMYERASALGLSLCLENTCNFQLPFVRKAVDALAGFAPFRLTWDAGHDARTGYLEMPVLMAHADRIAHMHLHDCANGSDHRPLYTGEVPINERLAFARARGLSVVIEVKTEEALRASVERLRREWLQGG
ncbi:sugar phosphate isomerase/epimerase [Paenibacillus sp. MWE-103]|uniref:Sugar phosphate isomerase/epimerase n=1 Tax=Paenibacillus artemisiicola TaxID=1172618 RepID=A0ABS3W989_9BACL|nr:TIM barrel protein [Paenibacillus artemisiicola]MBO7744892.1 sugar phosphate isomerase/epimerase [Paenibacillus artemisiicola]